MKGLIPIELFVPRHLSFFSVRFILFLERTVKNSGAVPEAGFLVSDTQYGSKEGLKAK